MSPGLSELAPSVLRRFYADAVPGKDNFVAGPSGIGYCIPELLPPAASTPGSLTQFAEFTSAALGKSDLTIVNTISNEDCDPSCTAPLVEQANIDAVFLYYGDAYCGRKGGVTWTGGKPVIGGRAALWHGFETPVSLARLLRSLPSDPRDAASYSLIPVHVWSRNVTSVVDAVALLGDYFDVVTPEELVAKMTANVFHDCGNAPVVSGPYSESCTGGSASCGALTGVSCSDSAGHHVVNPFFDFTVCAKSAVTNCNGRLICLGDPCPSSFPAPGGSYAGSCSGCVAAGGFLSGCACSGGETTNAVFDYTVCQNSLVANCYGALICQGQPCV